MLCAVLLWLDARNGRSLRAGIVLGLASSVKIFFGLFFIFFAARREWRLMATAVLTFVAVNLIGLSIFGFQNYYQYLAQHSAVSLYVNASWNASLMAFFTRLFGGAQNIPILSVPMLAYSLIYGISGLLIGMIVWISAPRKADAAPVSRFDLGFSLSLIAMLLISPYGWIYYFPCLIIPLTISWRLTSHLNNRRSYRAILLVIWALSSWPTRLISSESAKLNDPLIWFTSAGFYHYALIAFSAMLMLLAVRTGDGNPIHTFPLKR
jgi:hypothetical protein